MADTKKSRARAADTNEDYDPSVGATARETGKNSQGEPTIYPSDVEAVSTQYGLTSAEAERLLVSGKVTDKEADKIKGERVVYRPHYEYVAGTESNPLSVADRRREEAERAEADAEKARKGAADRIAEDKTSPEAGPYGPNAVYSEVEAPTDTDHTSPEQPPKEEK